MVGSESTSVQPLAHGVHGVLGSASASKYPDAQRSHTRSEVGVAACLMFSPGTHAVVAVHARLVVAVGGADSKALGKLHTVTGAHRRSVVAVSARVSYCSDVHARAKTQATAPVAASIRCAARLTSCAQWPAGW